MHGVREPELNTTLLAMDPKLDNPDWDTTIPFDPRPPGSFPLNSDPDSQWHTHAEHDAHFHPSHNRPHVSSHSHHRGGGHHHGHHHDEDDVSSHSHHRGAGHHHGHHNHDDVSSHSHHRGHHHHDDVSPHSHQRARGHHHGHHHHDDVSPHSHHRGGGHHHGHHHHHENSSAGDNNQRRPHRGAGHRPSIPNYRLSRDELRLVADRTLDALDNGWYIPYGTDVPVDLGPKLEYTDAQTTYYAPDDEEMAAWATKDLGQEKKETKILIKEYSTLVGARKLHRMLASLNQITSMDKAEAEAKLVQEDADKGEEAVQEDEDRAKEAVEKDEDKGKEAVEESIAGGEEATETNKPEDQPLSTETVEENEAKETEAGKEVKEREQPNEPQPTPAKYTIGVLNFASAKKPGGGFMNGAQAQEESIARASTLYPSLISNEGRKFYAHYRADPDNALYTHAMVYSPAVVLFRDDMGNWKKPIDVDVLTSAAVNAGEVREGVRREQEMYSLRVRAREAELGRRAEIERMWEEKERKMAEDERKAAEEERKAAEEERKAAKKDRKAAEEDRKAAEEERKVAEKERKVAEKERKAAEKERKVAEKERKAAEKERKAAEKEKKAAEEKGRKLVKEIKAAEEGKAADESNVEEKKETDEANAKDKDNHDEASDEAVEKQPTEEIESGAENVKVDAVERTSTQWTTAEEEEEPMKIDVPKDAPTSSDNKDSASPSTTPHPPADPHGPSKPLEPDSSSPPPADPPAPSKPLEPASSLRPSPRRARPTFYALPDLPPPPTLTLANAEDLISNTMYERIGRILFLFHQRGAMHLVLGSFGTGVFQNHVRHVAEIFYFLLVAPGAPFEGKFETVVFAILGGATVREFRDVFGAKAAPDGPDELDGEDSEIEEINDEVVPVGGASDPRDEDGKVDEPAQSAGVPQQDGAGEEKGMVVDQDVQTDALMSDDDAAKATNEPQDIEMVNLTEPPMDVDSTSDPAPPPPTDAQTQT